MVMLGTRRKKIILLDNIKIKNGFITSINITIESMGHFVKK